MSGAVEGVALLPCPFGHEFEAKYPPAPVQRMSWQKGLSEERCRVMCKCGAQGPVAEGSPAAINAWNTRTTPPARSYADEDVARIIDPGAWQERERLLVRKAEWEARPVIEGVDFVTIYARDADAQVAPSLAKAAAIRLLSQGGKA